MTEPVSIIIPCLNEEHYIGKLLVSLSKQTFQDFEVIIVDGHSKDDTKGSVEQALATHKNLQGRVHFYLADKKGVSHQRNLGATYAKYERLLFLDADVQVRPSFLETTLHEIAKKKLEMATVEFEPISQRMDDKLLYFIGNLYVKVQQYIEPVSMGVCIFSTKHAHDMIGGFDERLTRSEDYDYVNRAAKRGVLLKVLKKGKVYISIRRLNDEGRLNYYKKAILSEVYRLMDNKELHDTIEYDFGKFGRDPEAVAFDISEKEELWKKLLGALKVPPIERRR